MIIAPKNPLIEILIWIFSICRENIKKRYTFEENNTKNSNPYGLVANYNCCSRGNILT